MAVILVEGNEIHRHLGTDETARCQDGYLCRSIGLGLGSADGTMSVHLSRPNGIWTRGSSSFVTQ